MTRIGSLCTGYGGLDLAVQHVYGGTVAWVSDNEPGPIRVLERHHPDVPNLGDLTAAKWTPDCDRCARPTTLDNEGIATYSCHRCGLTWPCDYYTDHAAQPVDVLTAGFPCQPFSHAGQRKGTDDERHLWPHIAAAVGVLRPRLVVLENVAGILSMGGPVVVGDLAGLGYDCRWTVVRASDVGACHRRARWFCVAADTRGERRPQTAGRAHRGEGAERGRSDDHVAGSDDTTSRADGGMVEPAPADTDSLGQRQARGTATGEAAGAHDTTNGRDALPRAVRVATADADEPRPQGSQPAGRHDLPAGRTLPTPRTSDANGAGSHGDGGPDLRTVATTLTDAHNATGDRQRSRPQSHQRSDVAWGAYEPAIHRHEHALGRPAPNPTDQRGRLNPVFVEWMQMLPAGHVTDTPGLSRTAQLRLLGNGVVPAQAAHALRLLDAIRSAA